MAIENLSSNNLDPKTDYKTVYRIYRANARLMITTASKDPKMKSQMIFWVEYFIGVTWGGTSECADDTAIGGDVGDDARWTPWTDSGSIL